MSDTRTWELWRRGQAAALLPYDPVADAVVLIEQFRLPALAAGVDPTLVEVPAGLCEDNEDPADTIRREMQEEMHLDADRVERIGGFLLTPGGADEFCHLYAGRVIAPAADGEGIAGRAGEASEHEDIRIRVWDAEEAIQAAFAGCFTNSVLAIALFWLASKREWLRQKWMTA
jgi:ADP-ribose pyrophosphatase